MSRAPIMDAPVQPTSASDDSVPQDRIPPAFAAGNVPGGARIPVAPASGAAGDRASQGGARQIHQGVPLNVGNISSYCTISGLLINTSVCRSVLSPSFSLTSTIAQCLRSLSTPITTSNGSRKLSRNKWAGHLSYRRRRPERSTRPSQERCAISFPMHQQAGTLSSIMILKAMTSGITRSLMTDLMMKTAGNHTSASRPTGPRHLNCSSLRMYLERHLTLCVRTSCSMVLIPQTGLWKA